MATAATWTATLTFSGDDPGTKTHAAASNATSPASDQLVNLVTGANTYAAPTAATPTRLTIIPPSGNTVLITLKGVAGDTGVPLHKTDPTSVGVDSTAASVVLNAAAPGVNGVRLIWS
jgi:hypothetical protein